MQSVSNAYKVSICIPAYKYPNLLHRCLQSVLQQTYTNIEIIVTDDSLTDDLCQVVTALNDDRILYFKNPQPLGSPANWNAAIKKATGDLIKILHHDDYFTHSEALATFVHAYAQQPDILFWFSGHYDDFSGKKKNSCVSAKLVAKIEKQPTRLLLMNIIGAPSTTLFHKTITKHILFDEQTHWMVDVIFYIDVLLQYHKIGYVPQPLVSIAAGSHLQVTNTTKGIRKVQENIYAFSRYHLLNKQNFKSIYKWYFAELFKRYSLNNIQQQTWWQQLDTEQQQVLQGSRQLMYLPICYKCLALMRRKFVEYC